MQGCLTYAMKMTSKCPSICSNENFMNKLEWDDNIDNFFISHMADEARCGNYKHGAGNSDCLFNAQRLIHLRYGVYFTCSHIIKQLQHLERRYKAFSWIINHLGVQYDSETSKITAPAVMWDFFKKV